MLVSVGTDVCQLADCALPSQTSLLSSPRACSTHAPHASTIFILHACALVRLFVYAQYAQHNIKGNPLIKLAH